MLNGLLGFALGALAAIGATVAMGGYRETPRLVGHGCGSGGDLWANEESDFPACVVIERNR